MSIRYRNPEEVRHPRKFVRQVTVLFDGGAEGFSLAIIDWEGLDHVGIRWNVMFSERDDTVKASGAVVCDGSPAAQSGRPSWFILPREFCHPDEVRKAGPDYEALVAKWRNII
jgi:hypothetical protein